MQLGGEQQAAFEYTLKGSDLVNIVDYGGRGKSSKALPASKGRAPAAEALNRLL